MIIPVLDVMLGQVVRGFAGNRSEYRPIVSPLLPGSDPIAFARYFRDQFGFEDLYLADLDAILGSAPSLDLYRRLRAEGLRLWVDAGLRESQDAVPLLAAEIEHVIIGLETVAGPRALAPLVAELRNRLVFSLDLKAGEAWLSSEAWPSREVREIARTVLDLGVRRFLVLDVSRVGSGAGVGTESLSSWLLEKDADIEISVGGGIRHRQDIDRLHRLGIANILVASALHDGTIRP